MGSEERDPAARLADHAAIDALADELIPALIAKLGASGLGEIEVREGSWKVRLRRPADGVPGPQGRRAGRSAAAAQPARPSLTPVGPGRGAAQAGDDGEATRPPTTPRSSTGMALGRRFRRAAAGIRSGPSPPHRPSASSSRGPAWCRARASGPATPSAQSTCSGSRPRWSRRLTGSSGPASSSPGKPSSTARSSSGWSCCRRRRSTARAGPGASVRRRVRTGSSRRASPERWPAADVPEDPDCQPRRDRPARAARLPDPRYRGRRRVQRGRSRLAACASRRRSDLHRSGRRAAELPVGARGHQRGDRDRLRRDPPGLRLPVRGRDVRRGRRRPRPDVHRPATRGPRPVRQQGGNPAPAGRVRPADDPRLGRDAARRPARPRGGRADRLPGADQAERRGRRQGDADGPLRARARAGAQGLPVRGQGRVR